jgi:acetylcholinesterase
VGTILTAGLEHPIEAYLGIPYALSTAGEGRFRPPVKVPHSGSTFNATQYGHICAESSDAANNQGEDCLSLNLFRPQAQEPQKLPVLVYIHGGSFNFGSSQSRNIAELIAASSVPIIGVSMNYRIGALGFLPSTLTAKEGLLNLGLRDQVMAMQWVKENINAIGGDPERVTIMGDSAGGHSVRLYY